MLHVSGPLSSLFLNTALLFGCLHLPEIYFFWIELLVVAGSVFLLVAAMTWLTYAWYHACHCFIDLILIGICYHHVLSLRTCHLPGQEDLQRDNISVHCAFQAVSPPNLWVHFCLVPCSSGMLFLLMFCWKIFVLSQRGAMMVKRRVTLIFNFSRDFIVLNQFILII